MTQETIPHFKIDKKSLEIMRRLTSKSRDDGLEHGGTFCLDPENTKLTLENECIGDKCSIAYNRLCKDERKGVGTFHTHTDAETFGLSFKDLNTLILTNEPFGCLGTARSKENKIMCFEKRDMYSLREKAEEDLYVGHLKDYEEELKTELNYIDKRQKELEAESETISKKDALKSSILANEIQTNFEHNHEIQNRFSRIYEYRDKYFNKFFKKYNAEDLIKD